MSIWLFRISVFCILTLFVVGIKMILDPDVVMKYYGIFFIVFSIVFFLFLLGEYYHSRSYTIITEEDEPSRRRFHPI